MKNKLTVKKTPLKKVNDPIEPLLEKLAVETAKLRTKMLKSLMGVKTYNATMKNGGKGMKIKIVPQASPTLQIKQEKQLISFRSSPYNEESPIEELEILETIAIDVKKPSIRIFLSGRHLSTEKLAEYIKMI